MSEKNFGLIGVNGKMGIEISLLLKEHYYDCVFKYDLSGEEQNETPQVIIDFSLPDVFNKTLEFVKKFNCPLVIGTTGLTKEQISSLYELGKEVPIVQSYNFSIVYRCF